MIATELYDGQGLGNQLWCYFVTRIISEINGYGYGIMSRERFKGKDFINIDFGDIIVGSNREPTNKLPKDFLYYYEENHLVYLDFHIGVRDDMLLNVKNWTKIDGIMQSTEYINSFRDKIISWVNINDDKNVTGYSDDNICIIHIRGGDFNGSLAMLDSQYYKVSMNHMKVINPNMIFYIVTDDIMTSKRLLPNIEIIGSSTLNTQDSHKAIHHMGGPIWMDYTILNNAKHAIISASSFSWWPIWTNKNIKNVIAPKYWAAYKQSDGYWSLGDSIVNDWMYVDRFGNLLSSNECFIEKNIWLEKNKYLYESI